MARPAMAYIYRSLDEELLRGAMPSSLQSPPVLPPFHSMYLHASTVHTLQQYKYHKMIVVLYQLVMVMYMFVTPVCLDQVSKFSQMYIAVKPPIGILTNHF